MAVPINSIRGENPLIIYNVNMYQTIMLYTLNILQFHLSSVYK